MTDQIQELFSSIAPRYDLLNTTLSLGRDRVWRRAAVQHLKESRTVLDICAGTLSLSKTLLEINPEAEITAVDFSQEMLDSGQKHLSQTMANQIEPVCCDFFRFARLPASYDGAMCAYGMRNLDDNPLALKKIHELLARKGKLVVLEFFRPDRRLMKLFHSTYAQFIIPTLGRLISRHREAYEHLRDSIRGFYTLDQYCQLLGEAGFNVTTAKQLTGGISGLIVAEKPLPGS